MLVEKIKSEIKKYTLQKNNEAKSVLKVALGEIERKQTLPSDEECCKIILKLMASNQELSANGGDVDRLNQENEVLLSILPQEFSNEEIEAVLNANVEALKACKNNGQAIGMAVKLVKEAAKASGKSVNSGVVAEMVSKIRN